MGAILLCSTPGLRAQVTSLAVNKQALIFSTVKGAVSQPDTLTLSAKAGTMKIGFDIEGGKPESFKLVTAHSRHIVKGQKIKLVVLFSPASDLTGVAKAKLRIKNAAGSTIREIDLRGLSLNGLEGANEPTLATVFDALGYRVDPGWTSLAHDLQPDLRGDEMRGWVFRKAGKGKVELIPVARFSPDYELPFGYFTDSSSGPQPHQVGILAKTNGTPQHQTLFPGMTAGSRSFDPGGSVFGIYTSSPTHVSYSSDDWNLLLNPDKAGHAVRVYPAKDQYGKILANTYLVCFEEARNGDYQDYVFVLRNARPLAEQEEYTTLLNGRDLDGWDIFLKTQGSNNDNDPEHNFSVEDSAVHVLGKYLGYIRTKNSFTDYHFKVDFKWGEKRWPPRENAKRDAGICYNIPGDEPDSIWPRSIECQIQEGDVGDFWLLSGSTIEVDGKRNNPSNHTRIIKKKDGERPTGEWNTVEVISYRGRCIQIVNGLVVNDGGNASIKDGRILLQSEYSEVYYKNARISKL